jgi:hypothetical protein
MRNAPKTVFAPEGRLRPFPPQAVLGPTFTSGSGDDKMTEWSGPFTGLLLSDGGENPVLQHYV